MTKYSLTLSSSFRKSFKKLSKSDVLKANKVINTLLKGKKLDKKYKNHSLNGSLKDFNECHIKPDLLLIYRYFNNELELYLYNIGSHSDLF